MDCTTARLLLEFARPQGGDLEAVDIAALEQHLAGCGACQASADVERDLDRRLGEAMRRVEPPADLQQRLLHRLEAERNARQRAQVARILLRTVAAAAVLLLGLWGLWWWVDSRHSGVDPTKAWQAWVDKRLSREDVAESFRRQGVAISAHELPDYAYGFLTAHGLAELPGHPGRIVPALVFQDTAPAPGVRLHAVVWVVDTRHFSIAGLDDNFESPTGSSYRIEVLHERGDRFAYLVLHNGQNLDWLKPPEPPAT